MDALSHTFDDDRLAALRRALEASYPRLLARAHRLLAPRRALGLEAEELVSEAYLAAGRWVRKTHRDIDEARLEGLLTTALRRRFLDAVRAYGRRATVEVPLGDATLPPAPPTGNGGGGSAPAWGRPLTALRQAVRAGHVAVSSRQLDALVRALELREGELPVPARDAAERQNASRAARALVGWLLARPLTPAQRELLGDRGPRRDAAARLYAIGALPFLRDLARSPERAA
jgi:DNA-directed RNA polymerase specialized sigma24 family protein